MLVWHIAAKAASALASEMQSTVHPLAIMVALVVKSFTYIRAYPASQIPESAGLQFDA